MFLQTIVVVFKEKKFFSFYLTLIQFDNSNKGFTGRLLKKQCNRSYKSPQQCYENMTNLIKSKKKRQKSNQLKMTSEQLNAKKAKKKKII